MTATLEKSNRVKTVIAQVSSEQPARKATDVFPVLEVHVFKT